MSLGLTKSIGVSNFSCKKLQLLLSTAKIPPAVNQVEMNPLWQQKNLRDFVEIFWVPKEQFGEATKSWNVRCSNRLPKLEENLLPKVCLRWVYEQGGSVLVKSFNEERLKENLHIFDWELSAQDSEMIRKISFYRHFKNVAKAIKTVGKTYAGVLKLHR